MPAVLLLAWALSPGPALATSLIVPDQAPTIQAGLDARPDTVLVRPGTYAESPQVIYDVALLRTPGSSTDWVVVDSLTTHNEGYGPFYFSGLQVKGPVTIIGGGVSEYHFTQCDLQGSVDDHIKNYGMILSRCRVGGSLDLWIDYLTLDSCEVKGSVTTSKDMSPVIVRGCTIEGGGVSCLGDNNVYVENNTIRGGGFGVYSRSDVRISNNLIEDCSGSAITIDQGWATISNNVIRRCGAGISVDGGNSVSIAGNTLEQSRAYGLAVGGGVYDVNVTGNTFWNCVGDGMTVGYLQGGQMTARNNTSCMNGGSGFLASLVTGDGQEWTGNIGFGNAQYGFRWLQPGVATFGCNDWDGNALGELQGRAFSSTEFSVDPMFCDAPHGDLHLKAASPLVDRAGCGLIGALGVACGSSVGVIEPSAPADFALTRVGPVPTRGPIALELTLPRAAAIEVTVLDVQGRTVARIAGGEWSAGRHALAWNGEGARGRVPPGLYLVRYRYPGGQATRRIVIAR